MPKTAKTFDRFNLIRRISREMFVNGYRGYSDYLDTMSVQERRYATRADWIRNCLYDCVQWPEKGRKWISCDQMRIARNPLNRLYQANKMSNAFSYAFFLALCHMLQDGKELTIGGITKLLDTEYGIAGEDAKSKLDPRLTRYTAEGWLEKNKASQYRLSGWLPMTANHSGLSDQYPQLLDAVSFFAEQSALGIVGSQILDLCEYENEAFVFKHRYIAQVLDAIVLNDVLQAIQARKPIRIRAEQTSSRVAEQITALPIKVLSSTTDGRQYVLVFDMEEKRYRSIRLDYVEGVIPADISRKAFAEQIGKTVGEVFAEGEACMATMWSASARRQALHVSVEFRYDPRKEYYIRNRICRETRGKGTLSEEAPGLIRYECDVDHPLEMATWLLSLTGYVQSLKADDQRNTHRLGNRFAAHIRNLHDVYHSKARVEAREQYELRLSCPPDAEKALAGKQAMLDELFAGFCRISEQMQQGQDAVQKKTRREISEQIRSGIRKARFEDTVFDVMVKAGMIGKPVEYEISQAVSDETLGQWRKRKDKSGLFLSTNSCYVYVYRYILRMVNRPMTQARIQRIIDAGIRAYGFADSCNDITFRSMLEVGMLRESETRSGDAPDTPLYEAFLQIPAHGLYRPLTDMELRWLRAILDEPQMQLFLDRQDIQALRERLKEYTPLYRAEDIVYFDMYTDGDDYADQRYIEHFRHLHQRIQLNNRPVRLTYLREKDKAQRKATAMERTVYPVRLEYSKRDNKFRLLAYEAPGGEEGAEHSPVRASGLLPLRLSNILSVEDAPGGDVARAEFEWQRMSGEEICREPVEVRVAGRHKARERFMIALMPYRKEVQYDANLDDCRVRIWYSSSDVKELLSALRSYGDAVEVIGPKNIRADIVRRVDRQYALLSGEMPAED
ncbi:MAG: WYL domain-containing protein [Aristaeellaceae bacterium]